MVDEKLGWFVLPCGKVASYMCQGPLGYYRGSAKLRDGSWQAVQ